VSAAADLMIETELWVSLQSLLQAYAAAAEAHGELAVTVESTEKAVIITAASALLQMNYDAATGEGTWTLRRHFAELSQGQFRLLQSGRIALGGQELDLDHAAIDWIAELMRAGRGQ
jgi:hypothetical protein